MMKNDSKKSKTSEIIILGLDPGTATTGWSVIKKSAEATELVAYGCIETCKTKCAPDRLKEIGDDLLNLIKTYKPDEAAVEDLFFFKNLKTAIKVAQARGVLLLVCRQQKVSVYEYTPLQIKQGLTGYGRADKNQVQQMVKQLFKLNSIPKPDDAADAIAVAVCHEQSRGYLQL